jgi:hypothetical protein
MEKKEEKHAIYNENYYYNLLKIHTPTAHDIVKKRYDFIEEAILSQERLPEPTILDYGCGVGFMKALAPEWVHQIDTFDVMPVPTTGMTLDRYDIVMMYDVLEHIPDFTDVQPIIEKCRYVVLTVPMKPDNVPWKGYKHFKPSEHLHYFTDDLLKHLFDYMGFDFFASGTPECPPREYVSSYIFRNRNHHR